MKPEAAPLSRYGDGDGSIDLGDGLVLRAGARATGRGGFPTDALQKGLTLEYRGRDLCEEGVGFGVPVLKKGLEAIFPGASSVRHPDADPLHLVIEYRMNLGERLALRGNPRFESPLVSSLKDIVALLHRSYPITRGALTGISNAMRALFGIRTVFERRPSAGTLVMEYRIDPSAREILMSLDASGLDRDGLTELIVMNELGARHFREYADSDGLSLRDRGIGTWSPVAAAEASFRDPRYGILFRLRRVKGARLFRGRELVRRRLAWSGFAYVMPPETVGFRFPPLEVVRGAGAPRRAPAASRT